MNFDELWRDAKERAILQYGPLPLLTQQQLIEMYCRVLYETIAPTIAQMEKHLHPLHVAQGAMESPGSWSLSLPDGRSVNVYLDELCNRPTPEEVTNMLLFKLRDLKMHENTRQRHVRRGGGHCHVHNVIYDDAEDGCHICKDMKNHPKR